MRSEKLSRIAYYGTRFILIAGTVCKFPNIFYYNVCDRLSRFSQVAIRWVHKPRQRLGKNGFTVTNVTRRDTLGIRSCLMMRQLFAMWAIS